MDARLSGVLAEAKGDPAEAWRLLHARAGRRATLIDRYELEAAARGLRPEQLDPEERARLTREVLKAQYPNVEFVGAASGDPVEVVPYDPSWPAAFERWRELLHDALGATAVRIEHVGSTAVPGLPAKPILDIQVSVPDVEDEGAYVPAVETLGVPLRFREPGHRYFRPRAGEPHTVHIHVCDAGGEWEREHLVFRDHLRADAGAREDYARLKAELGERYRGDRLAYTDAKTAFILDLLERAERRVRQ